MSPASGTSTPSRSTLHVRVIEPVAYAAAYIGGSATNRHANASTTRSVALFIMPARMFMSFPLSGCCVRPDVFFQKLILVPPLQLPQSHSRQNNRQEDESSDQRKMWPRQVDRISHHADLALHRGQIRNGMSPHEQSMRVDGIRRACNEGHVVSPRFDCKRFGLLRQYRENPIDLIGKCLLEDLHVKDVTKLHLVEIGEEFCGRQPAMSGDGRMGGRAAHGQRRGLDVPRGPPAEPFLRWCGRWAWSRRGEGW